MSLAHERGVVTAFASAMGLWWVDKADPHGEVGYFETPDGRKSRLICLNDLQFLHVARDVLTQVYKQLFPKTGKEPSNGPSGS